MFVKCLRKDAKTLQKAPEHIQKENRTKSVYVLWNRYLQQWNNSKGLS